MDAEFPCDPADRQPLALRLLNGVPPCRLKRGGLPALAGRRLSDSGGAVVDGRVVSIAGVHTCVECRQGLLPAPAQTVETAICGWPPCEEEPLKLLSMPGRGGASWLAMTSPW